MKGSELPLPPHFDADAVARVWRVPYEERAREAKAWAQDYRIMPAATDEFRIALLVVDVQNTFCIPDFELFVAGRSGTGAVDDNRRLCEFIYRNLGLISQVVPTMDTHHAMQIFHAISLVNDAGEHPSPYSLITVEDIEEGRWNFNPCVGETLGIDADYAERHLSHYARQLEAGGKYSLTIWPYHSMLGGIGHALVSSVEEAIFFHTVARCSQPDFQVKGDSPLTEHYSVLGPEVRKGPDASLIGEQNFRLIEKLLTFDLVVVAGQAKSHCVAWTIDDLLSEDADLAERVYLLEDCTSPVVVPGVVDYTEESGAAFARFSAAGMRVVQSVDPIENWPGLRS